MDINPKILSKIKELTMQESEIGEFLVELLNFESGGTGWYKETYNKLIVDFAAKRGSYENSKH